MIEATVGSGYRGDIAIDDVTMSSGSCSQGMALTCSTQIIGIQVCLKYFQRVKNVIYLSDCVCLTICIQSIMDYSFLLMQ